MTEDNDSESKPTIEVKGSSRWRLRDINKKMVEESIKQFDYLGRTGMLARYGGKRSTRWYVYFNNKYYDQKLLLRGAHELGGLGALPPGRGTFTAAHAKEHLEYLEYRVVSRT